MSSVSDISIYPYLKKLRIPLYIHPHIHLKLLIFNDALAFHTSGNITQSGLGLQPRHNIEIGCQVEISYSDWGRIYELLSKSTRVDDAIYQTVCKYCEENGSKAPPLPPLKMPKVADKRFSKLSLPSSPNPELLFQFYQAPNKNDDADTEAAAFMHDLTLYQIPPSLGREEFFSTLAERFKNHAFIQAIVQLIQGEGSARFGLVNEWLTANCSDKPTPFRWEMKIVTHRLYEWLEYFFREITWDVPGDHSMVIYWNQVDDAED